MRLSLMKKAAIGSVLYSMAAMGLIYYLSYDKAITISDVAQDEVIGSDLADSKENGAGAGAEAEGEPDEDSILTGRITEGETEGKAAELSEENQTDENAEEPPKEEAQETAKPEEEGGKEAEGKKQELIFGTGKSNSSFMRIPLPAECKAEDIVVENYYMNRELCILVGGVDSGFYASNVISGNLDMVEKGVCEENIEANERGVKLRFSLTDVFEYRTILENHDLYVSFLRPREMYDKIVVIDPSCGGSNTGNEENGLSEKEISLQIAKKVKERLDETDVKVYYTRMDDSNPGEEDRVRLANGTKADMYIRIQVDANTDSSVYGATTIYNEDYFIPGFGSVELADILEREVVTSIKGKALGLSKAQEEDYAIRSITIPAAAVKVGCLTNKQEAILLGREEYQEKIADGICNAIMAVYEED
ncbi:N-acetylmuramoyl-L-alanine amidase family protein [Parablautia muri]|nr:N-acetylmuramoyl-L-alanine amidase [Parablautia muri]